MKEYAFPPRSLPLIDNTGDGMFAGRIGLRRRTDGKRHSEMV